MKSISIKTLEIGRFEDMPDLNPVPVTISIKASDVPEDIKKSTIYGQIGDHLFAVPFIPQTSPQVISLDPLVIMFVGTVYVPDEALKAEEEVSFFISDVPIDPSVDTDHSAFEEPAHQDAFDDTKVKEMERLINMPQNKFEPPNSVTSILGYYKAARENPATVLEYKDSIVSASLALQDNANKQWLLDNIRSIAVGDKVDSYLLGLLAKEIQ